MFFILVFDNSFGQFLGRNILSQFKKYFQFGPQMYKTAAHPLNFFIFYTGETITWDSRLATAGIGIAYPGPIKFSTAVVEDSLASVTFGVRIVDAPRNYGVADWMIIYIWLEKSFDVHGYRFRTSRLGMNKETLIRKTSVFLYYVFTCFSKYTSKEFLNGVCFVSTDLTPRFSIPFMVRFVNSTPWF